MFYHINLVYLNTSIGEGKVIGAHSFVNSNLFLSINVGNPAKKIKMR